jgi:hypothetical protein
MSSCHPECGSGSAGFQPHLVQQQVGTYGPFCATCTQGAGGVGALGTGYKHCAATFLVLCLQVNQTQAEANCNQYGGHLAAYTSLEEQVGQGAAGCMHQHLEHFQA